MQTIIFEKEFDKEKKDYFYLFIIKNKGKQEKVKFYLKDISQLTGLKTILDWVAYQAIELSK